MSDAPLDEVLFNHNQQKVEYAGFWIRVLASLIDSFVLVPIVLLSFYNMFNLKSIVLMVILVILQTIYKPFLEWRYGATLGKMAVKIQVVTDQLGRITMEQAIGRYVPWLISQVLSLITTFLLFNSPEFNDMDGLQEMTVISENLPLNDISTVYSFIFILLVGSLVIDKRKQGVHDKIARTLCIKKNR
jgi:uncharacterized RDD family membrane protein YckC